MITGLTILITLVCVLLMTAILIQNPKGGGIDSTFGGSGTSQILGTTESTNFIEKLTWTLVTTVFVLCITTALIVI